MSDSSYWWLEHPASTLEAADLSESPTSRSSVATGKEIVPPCCLGRSLQGSSEGDLGFSSIKMVSHLSQFFIADSAKVLSEKQCAMFGLTPTFCVDSSSLRFYCTALMSFD